MKFEFVSIGISFDGHVWRIGLATSAPDDRGILLEQKFPHSPSGFNALVSQAKVVLDATPSDKKRCILVIHQPESDQLFPFLFPSFQFLKPIHPDRLVLHANRLGIPAGEMAVLAARAAVTSLDMDELLLESTNVCTFNCLYCTQDQVTRKKDRMPLELARRLVDEYAESSIGSISFHLMGEPTLNPDLPEIIKYVAEKKISHCLVTNGSLLTQEKAERLFANGLRHMTISVQTFTPEQHAAFKRPRPYFTYDRLLENIRGIILAKWAKGPLAKIEIHVMDTSLYQPRGVHVVGSDVEASNVLRFWIDFVRTLARDHGRDDIVQQISNLDAVELARSLWPLGECHIEPLISLTFKSATHWIQNFLKEDELILLANRGSCLHLADGRRHMAILASGDAVMCCFDYNGQTRFGNAKELSLIQLDERAKAIRRRLLNSDSIPYRVCRRCMGIRVRKLGGAQATPGKEFEVRKVIVFATGSHLHDVALILQNRGVHVLGCLKSPEGMVRSFSVESTCEGSLVEQRETDQAQAIIFSAFENVDHGMILILERRFPHALLVQIDLVGLNPLDRQAIEGFRSWQRSCSSQKIVDCAPVPGVIERVLNRIRKGFSC